MNKTLSLNRRTHLFIRDAALFIKLQTPHNRMPDKADIYILKKLPLDDVRKIRNWCDALLKESDYVKTD